MTEHELILAKNNRECHHRIKRELEIWNKEIKKKGSLGYLQSWNSFHATKLETNMSDEIFEGFRMSVIYDLELQMINLDKDFGEM